MMFPQPDGRHHYHIWEQTAGRGQAVHQVLTEAQLVARFPWLLALQRWGAREVSSLPTFIVVLLVTERRQLVVLQRHETEPEALSRWLGLAPLPPPRPGPARRYLISLWRVAAPESLESASEADLIALLPAGLLAPGECLHMLLIHTDRWVVRIRLIDDE